MDGRTRSWLSSRWRRIRRHPAQDEGLAAGTGLLTGPTARIVSDDASRPCPECGGPAEVVVLDLIAHDATWRCEACHHEWIEPGVPARRRAR